MKVQLLQEIEFLLHDAEERVWGKADAIMLALYWDLGYALHDYSKEEVEALAKELSVLFNVEESMFVIAYNFYHADPIRKHALKEVV
ncbi:hypothetical protein HZA98_03520 [Candidatus Woesearchaeota archaeon]|nr:hypothetical protein [Candidatus Woesearchaeota archaeon]